MLTMPPCEAKLSDPSWEGPGVQVDLVGDCWQLSCPHCDAGMATYYVSTNLTSLHRAKQEYARHHDRMYAHNSTRPQP